MGEGLLLPHNLSNRWQWSQVWPNLLHTLMAITQMFSSKAGPLYRANTDPASSLVSSMKSQLGLLGYLTSSSELSPIRILCLVGFCVLYGHQDCYSWMDTRSLTLSLSLSHLSVYIYVHMCKRHVSGVQVLPASPVHARWGASRIMFI
jgi:hypothetical protein